jgi:hypothetical protein
MSKAMDNNKEVKIEMIRNRAGFEPAHINMKTERTLSHGKDKGSER